MSVDQPAAERTVITRRHALAALGLAAAGLAAPGFVRRAGAALDANDMVLGDPGAPITMIEYASLTCPHCASFHNDTFPRIKTEYIDTGKVRLIYRDFPTRPVALAIFAAMLARCAGRTGFFGFIEVLYRTQGSWLRANDPVKALGKIARLGGVSQAELDACSNDNDLFQSIRNAQEQANREFGVRSTPTFIINGEKVEGPASYERLKDILDRMLAKS